VIISHLIGGLGNQMFQYAAGRALSEGREQPLLLDVSSFESYELHNGFELQKVFDGPFHLAKKQDVSHVLGWRAWPPLRRVLGRRQMGWARGMSLVVEPHFHYWDGFFSVPNDCYIVGYWQSARYFGCIEKAIRRAFSFKQPLAGKGAEVAGRIAGSNAVSLHIRRGDYAKDPKTKATHGLLPLSYYHAAVLRIAQSVDNPRFFVFSDDIAWARDNLRLDFDCEYVDHNQGMNSYRDMQLMSLCQHNIIANSSFSWWGAWLNPNSEKIVVCPRRWFRSPEINIEHLFPKDWIVVDG